jgi:hypothetical protein
VKPKLAHLLGAGLGVLSTTAYVVWKRTSPPPCTGAVFIELRPPLIEPGPYHFRITLDRSDPPCDFDVPLPMKQRVDTKACDMALTLDTRVNGSTSSIVGLTLGAAPDRLGFLVRRNGEKIYDTEIEPRYAPYATRREESKRFCGDRAFVQPQCVRGSSQCAPYPASCSGPRACPDGKVCCVSPEQAREYGTNTATECSSARACLDRFGLIACASDADCREGSSCTDKSVTREFTPPLTVCSQRPAH